MLTYFDILQVPLTASADEIRTAYRTLAKRYHPDVNNHPAAHLQFQQLQEAYATLSDPYRKARYIQRLRNHPLSQTTKAQPTSPDAYEQWLKHQQREKLKRYVAEMRRKREEEENKKDWIWYLYAGIRIVLLLLGFIGLFTFALMPLYLYFFHPETREESGFKLIIASIIGSTFLAIFCYQMLLSHNRK